MHVFQIWKLLFTWIACFALSRSAQATVIGRSKNSNEAAEGSCQSTQVLILGAGMAGITAGSVLTNMSIHDFMILEYNSVIGGRVAHQNFGHDADGNPYVIELGANWVQGLGTEGGPENPIWTLAKRYNVTNTYSNYSDILTYDHTGPVDYTDLIDVTYEDAYSGLEEYAGDILNQSLLDRSARAGLSIAGWTPRRDMHKQAVDFWQWDWEYAFSPEESSQAYGIVNYNTTFYQYSEANNFVFDPRGFNTFIEGLGSTYLAPNDSRLLFNTHVTNISYPSIAPSAGKNITVYTANGTCFSAPYAILTFSLGVQQAALASPPAVNLTFKPTLPDWKSAAINDFSMGIYTKIFLQFPVNTTQFWPVDTQFFLYASPTTRGYYPVWQSLSTPGFIEGSNILFVTVVDRESARVESQSDAETQREVLAVLRQMFPNATIPDPVAFFYPRWGITPWAMGSYSNWPPGVSLESHQNLRANIGGLFWAGEATSSEYFGFLQAAYFEGQSAAEIVAECITSGGENCTAEKHYNTLKGPTPAKDYTIANGWTVSSFQTIGDE